MFYLTREEYLIRKESNGDYVFFKAMCVFLIICWIADVTLMNSTKSNSVVHYEQSDSKRVYQSTFGEPKSFDRTNNSEYWKSVSRQKALEDMGMDRAAEIERNARLKYIQGGGYHSKDGTSQIQFQGSKEQAEQLRMMDEMGW